MGNQLRALDAALAVARVLGRVLVVPDYMADNGAGESGVVSVLSPNVGRS